MNHKLLPLLFSLTIVLSSCMDKANTPLPIIGHRDVVDGDTVYTKIADFSFINQDSQIVTNETFAGKAYVADFFFISCPTICPKQTKQMLRVHDRFKDNDNLLLLAHSIDTKYDTIPRLKDYADKLGVSSDKWHFITGVQEEIFDIADDYYSIALINPDAPGGYDHSGRLILVDKDRHVRSFCDGTDPEAVDRFMLDVERLLRMEFND